MSNTFVILKRCAVANGVKVHFHNENQGDKKEQWPPGNRHFLLPLSQITPTDLDLILFAIIWQVQRRNDWDILSFPRFFSRNFVSFVLECYILSHTALLVAKCQRQDFFRGAVYLHRIDEFASQHCLRKMDNFVFCRPHFLLFFCFLWLIAQSQEVPAERSSVLVPLSLSPRWGNRGRFTTKTYDPDLLRIQGEPWDCLDTVDTLQKTKQNKSPTLK